jgi:hypothetical protein
LVLLYQLQIPFSTAGWRGETCRDKPKRLQKTFGRACAAAEIYLGGHIHTNLSFVWDFHIDSRGPTHHSVDLTTPKTTGKRLSACSNTPRACTCGRVCWPTVPSFRASLHPECVSFPPGIWSRWVVLETQKELLVRRVEGSKFRSANTSTPSQVFGSFPAIVSASRWWAVHNLFSLSV